MSELAKEMFDPDTRALLEISRVLGSTCELDEVFRLVVETSMGLLGAERATLFLYDRERNELVSRVAEGTGELRIPADKGIAGAAAMGLASVNVPDAYADERFNRAVDRQTGYRTRNILACPLRDYDGQLVGVLQVLNKAEGSFDERDVALAEAFSAQAGVALQRSRLVEAFLEKRRMEEAMLMAREIQQRLLPREAPAVAGFDVACWNRPCDQTGGDYCDFLRLGGERLAVSFGDVSGHGVGPALVSCATRAMLRALCTMDERVERVMGRVNRLTEADLGASRFVTAFLGILDGETREMAFTSAGQGPLFRVHGAAGEVEVLGADGVPVGILSEVDYPQPRVVRFEEGDLFVLLTDGFMEWARADGEQFGIERMGEVLRGSRGRSAGEILRVVLGTVEEFAETAQGDDLTAIVIKAVGL